MSKHKGFTKARALLQELQTAEYKWTKDGTLTRWKSECETALERMFRGESRHLQAFAEINYLPIVITARMPESEWIKSFNDGVLEAKATLQAAIIEFEEYDLEEVPHPGSENPIEGRFCSSRVFVVHGHDHGIKEEIARFLEKIGLDPIILHEQANKGKTIVEKFEANSDVGFAVVLLTPDDHGGVTGSSETKLRARQNVILELGYFLGKLGRDRVAAIVKDNLEIPSDYDGVVYIPYDSGWKPKLAKELQVSSMAIDLGGLIT